MMVPASEVYQQDPAVCGSYQQGLGGHARADQSIGCTEKLSLADWDPVALLSDPNSTSEHGLHDQQAVSRSPPSISQKALAAFPDGRGFLQHGSSPARIVQHLAQQHSTSPAKAASRDPTAVTVSEPVISSILDMPLTPWEGQLQLHTVLSTSAPEPHAPSRPQSGTDIPYDQALGVPTSRWAAFQEQQRADEEAIIQLAGRHQHLGWLEAFAGHTGPR